MKLREVFLAAVLGCWAGSTSGQEARFLNKSTNEWLVELNHADPLVRGQAAFALGKLGQAAHAAVPHLQHRLQVDKEARVRDAAAFALGEIVRDNPKVPLDAKRIALLIKVLRDPAPLVRRSAAFALGCHGPAAAAARKALEAALNDEQVAVRQNAAWALGRLATVAVVPALKKALGDRDLLVRRDAAGALDQLPPEAVHETLPELLQCCATDNPVLQQAALLLLSKIVKPKDPVAKVIAPLMQSGESEVRCLAALVLAKAGEAVQALPLLRELLRSGDNRQRYPAVAALADLGPEAAPAVPDLIRALTDADDTLRRHAALALGKIGAAAEPAIPHLAERLVNPQEKVEVRVEAATALSHIGAKPAAEKIIPALVRILADIKAPMPVRERTMWALRVHNIMLREVPEFLKALADILDEKRPAGAKMLYYDSAYMLGMLQGPKAPDLALEDLLNFLKDNSTLIYYGTLSDIKIPNENPADLKARTTGMGDGRKMAVQALTQIGPRIAKRKDILQQVQIIAFDDTLWSRLRYDCAHLLALRQGPKVADRVLDVLLQCLKDSSLGDGRVGDDRIKAVDALEQIGPRVAQRQDIVNQLRILADDPKLGSSLRDKAKELLKALGK